MYLAAGPELMRERMKPPPGGVFLLESAGSSLTRVVRVHVVLSDIGDLAEMDRVYRDYERRKAAAGRTRPS